MRDFDIWVAVKGKISTDSGMPVMKICFSTRLQPGS
jgi:hypothetical protein